jgi:polyisoprenoid-binding protein YceI
VGFRIRETVLFTGDDVVYRTNAVTGALVVSGDRITTADFRVDLTTFTTRRGTTQPQIVASLDTRQHPDATFELTQPITLPPTFARGATATTTAGGRLTLRGVTRAVTITITGRRDGATLQAAGSIPVTFAEFGIQGPAGYGPLGSLADHGTAEFLVILHQ